MITVVTIVANEDLEKLPLMLDSLPPDVKVVIVETAQDDYVHTCKPQIIDIADRKVLYSLYYYAKGYFNFSNVRNYAKSIAKGDWIISLDADERLLTDPKALESLPMSVGGVYMLNASFSASTGTWSTSAMLRAFRNDPRLAWRFGVHEQILPSILDAGYETLHSDMIIQHSGYNDGEDVARKLRRNINIMYQDLAKAPNNTYLERKLIDSLLYLREGNGNNNQ